MASNVPEFGKWENGNVPYTAFFDKARNKRSGRKPNADTPEENRRNSSSNAAPVQMDSKSSSHKGREAIGTKHMFITQAEKMPDFRKPAGSPLHHNVDTSLNRHTTKSSSDAAKKAMQSPLHARVGGKDNGMSWEKRIPNEDGNSFPPRRPRMQSVTRGHETIDQGVAVPKFGEWDESNPRSADGYTHVFNKVREEKLNNRAGQVMAPGTPKTPLSTVRKHDGSVKFKRCLCFGWFGK